MPRLPGIAKVTRVSNDGLRLQALRPPRVDPTGAAMQDFGQSLGKFGEALDEFDKKRKALKEAESRIELDEFDASLFRDRAKGDKTEGDVPLNPDGFPPATLLEIAEERVQSIKNPEQRARMKAIVDAQSEAHKVSVATEDHNLRAAALVSRVDGVLSALRETVGHKPQLLEVSFQRGLAALRANRESLGLTDEALQTREKGFERDLLTEAVRTRIGRGEAAKIFKELQDPEMRAMFGEAAADQLTHEAEARQISEVTAILSSLDIHNEAIANTGTGIEGLTAEAEAKLSPEDLTRYRAREQAAQGAHRFSRRFEYAPRSALEADLETAFPGELASEEDNDKFDAVRNKATAMLKERDINPGAIAGRDPVVAALRRTGNEEQAASLALAIQERMEVPPAVRKIIATEEARREAAALDGGLIVERPSQILKLKEKYGRHFDAVLDEMRVQGLDPETAAMAAVVDNPKALQTLMQTVGVPYTKLTEGTTPEEISAVRSALATERDTLQQQGRLSPGIDNYIYEKLALRSLEQTGNPQLSAKRAVETLEGPEAPTTGDGTIQGGSGHDELLIAMGNQKGVKNSIEIDGFFDERWEEDDETFVAEAAEFGLNPDRALLLRDILKAAQKGVTEEEKTALLKRTEGRPIVFRRLTNSLNVGEKKEEARKIAGLVLFKDLAGEDRPRTKAEMGIEFLENLPGRTRKPSTKPGATQGNSGRGTGRAKVFALPNSDVPFPTKIGKKNFKEDYEKWFESEGKALIEKRAKSNLKKIRPAESFIWRNLITAKSIGNTRKTNNLKGKRLRHFEWDFTHGEIEVFNRKGIHLGAMDPLTGKMIKPADPTKFIKVSANDQPPTIRPV